MVRWEIPTPTPKITYKTQGVWILGLEFVVQLGGIMGPLGGAVLWESMSVGVGFESLQTTHSQYAPSSLGTFEVWSSRQLTCDHAMAACYRTSSHPPLWTLPLEP